jgi:hypothetical protein
MNNTLELVWSTGFFCLPFAYLIFSTVRVFQLRKTNKILVSIKDKLDKFDELEKKN